MKKWEEATGRKAGEAKEIKLIGVYPPIEKMEVCTMQLKSSSKQSICNTKWWYNHYDLAGSLPSAHQLREILSFNKPYQQHSQFTILQMSPDPFNGKEYFEVVARNRGSRRYFGTAMDFL